MGNESEFKGQTKEIPFEQIIQRLTEHQERAHYGEDRPGLTKAHQPKQPTSGPGGSAYKHREVRTNLYAEGNLAYWLYEPVDPSPQRAPLVTLLHGWGGGSPSRFGAWIDHLVKRGNIVLFPVYQGSLRPWAKPWDQVPASEMLTNVTGTVKDAIQRLQKGDHVQPNLERFAITGLSLGGALTAQMAAVAQKNGLPVPRAIMPIAPGRPIWARRSLPVVDLRTIPSSLLMIVVVCEDDKTAGDREGRRIFAETSQISPENKNLVVMLSDYHGTPPLVANHSSPAAYHPNYEMAPLIQNRRLNRPGKKVEERDFLPPSALHYYGYWKLFDALTDAAFYQQNREYALGATPQQRFMGIWSDGAPVKELTVITNLHMLPRRLGHISRSRRWSAWRSR